MQKHVAPKAPFSFKRHIVSPLVGITVFVSIMGLLNAQWISAQAQYRFGAPHALELSDTFYKGTPETSDPTIYIPKIGSQSPIIFGGSGTYDIEENLKKGTAHYALSAKPGQNGNTVIFGHSSGMPWDPGNYKFIFTLLDKLVPNDRIIIDYDGVRYIYRVTGTRIVKPDDISVLDQLTKENKLTLITCTPVGSNSKRLVVDAVQVSPKPVVPANSSPVAPAPTTTTQLPGSSSSFWKSIKDLF